MDEWDLLVLYSELSDAQLCQEEEECLGLGALRRERNRGYRSAGGNVNEEKTLGPLDTPMKKEWIISRPANIRQWAEFKNHTWGKPAPLNAETVQHTKTHRRRGRVREGRMVPPNAAGIKCEEAGRH